MIAEHIMTTKIVATDLDERVKDVFTKMHSAKLRMLPVLNADGIIVGVVSTFSLLSHIVPDYLVSGDLHQISYAPDIGILKPHFEAVVNKPVAEVMDTNLLLVQPKESLISVSAALTEHDRHGYAMVVDKENKLLGVISAGDIINRLSQKASEFNNA